MDKLMKTIQDMEAHSLNATQFMSPTSPNTTQFLPPPPDDLDDVVVVKERRPTKEFPEPPPEEDLLDEILGRERLGTVLAPADSFPSPASTLMSPTQARRDDDDDLTGTPRSMPVLGGVYKALLDFDRTDDDEVSFKVCSRRIMDELLKIAVR